MIIIGIDWSTDPKNTGLALGLFEHGDIIIKDIRIGSKNEPPLQIVVEWLHEKQVALLAVDAPLGWPIPLAQALPKHSAGQALEGKRDSLFCRLTDHVVNDRVKKKPLEVGANLIARTAQSALEFLHDLRNRTGLAIPLAWEPTKTAQTSVIEVYPAATLTALHIQAKDYRKKDSRKERLYILKQLGLSLENKQLADIIESSPHALDAVICLVAASDFLLGKCIPVNDPGKARKEGWIWVRKPEE